MTLAASEIEQNKTFISNSESRTDKYMAYYNYMSRERHANEQCKNYKIITIIVNDMYKGHIDT